MITFLLEIDDIDARDYFKKLYYEHHDDMFLCAVKMLKNHHDAEDALQQVLLRLWMYMDNIKKISSCKLKGYLIKSTHNYCCNVIKSASSRKELSFDEGLEYSMPANYDVEDVVWDRHKWDILMEALDSLSPQYRQIILDKTILHLSDEQIAEHIGIKPSYARECLHRARNALKKKYVEMLSSSAERNN